MAKSKASKRNRRLVALQQKEATVGLNPSERREMTSLLLKPRPIVGPYSPIGRTVVGPYTRLKDQVLVPAVPQTLRRQLTNAAVNEDLKRKALGQPQASENIKSLVWRNLGSTDAGRDWAYQALHPCGDGKDACGLPDTVCAAVATPSYRSESTISWDVTMFDKTPANVTTYSVQLIVPPIPEIDYCYRLRDDANNTWSKWRAVRLPGFSDLTQSSGTTLHTIGYSQYRIIGRGATLELNASDIANQGRVISGQIDAFDRQQDQSLLAPVVSNEITPFNYASTVMRVPATSGFLVANAPNVYQEEAKQGAYVVMKFKAPLKGFQFTPCGTGDYSIRETKDEPKKKIAVPNNGLTLFATDDAALENVNRWTADSIFVAPEGTVSMVSNILHPYVSLIDGTLTSVTFFEGLVIGTGGSATATGATIRVKSRLNLECLSFGGPAIAPFIHPGPLYDDLAISQVAKIAQMAPDAYPASYNSFGSVMNSIWGWIKRIGRPALTGVAAAFPAAAPIALAGLAGMELVDNTISGIHNASL